MPETMAQRIMAAIIAELDEQPAVYVGDTELNGVSRPDVMVDGRVDMPAVARAIIAAMREPTDAMCRLPRIGRDANASDIWAGMIDAALAEE